MSQSILLGVTGGIAAYKSVDLVRRLRARDHPVRVIMTQSAQSFVTPLTFQAVSGQPAGCDLLDAASEATLSLTANPDIIHAVGQLKPKPFTVGFAAQTHDVKLHAMRKYKDKNMDAIIANQVDLAEGEFDSDVNCVEIYSAKGVTSFALQPKTELAYKLIEWIAQHYETKDSAQDIR